MMISSAGSAVAAAATSKPTAVRSLACRSFRTQHPRSYGTATCWSCSLVPTLTTSPLCKNDKRSCLWLLASAPPLLCNDAERALWRAGYVNELEHGRFGEMSKGEKFGTAAGGLALAGILYEVRARRRDDFVFCRITSRAKVGKWARSWCSKSRPPSGPEHRPCTPDADAVPPMLCAFCLTEQDFTISASVDIWHPVRDLR